MLFLKNHFEGGYLFRDMVTLEATPPGRRQRASGRSNIRFANQRERAARRRAIVDEDRRRADVRDPDRAAASAGHQGAAAREDELLEPVAQREVVALLCLSP